MQAAAHIHRFLSLDENVLRMSADASEGMLYYRFICHTTLLIISHIHSFYAPHECDSIILYSGENATMLSEQFPHVNLLPPEFKHV